MAGWAAAPWRLTHGPLADASGEIVNTQLAQIAVAHRLPLAPHPPKPMRRPVHLTGPALRQIVAPIERRVDTCGGDHGEQDPVLLGHRAGRLRCAARGLAGPTAGRPT